MHELISLLEPQRFARAGGRGIELLHGEIDLDRVAASREHLGEAHDVSRTSRRASSRLAGYGDRRLAHAMNDTPLSKPRLDRRRQSPVFSQATGSWQ